MYDYQALEFSVRAMKNLKEAGRSNNVYDLAKGFGTKRRSSDDTLFPTKDSKRSCIFKTSSENVL